MKWLLGLLKLIPRTYSNLKQVYSQMLLHRDPLSGSDLVAFVGTAIETWLELFTKLKEEKIIKVHGRKILVRTYVLA